MTRASDPESPQQPAIPCLAGLRGIIHSSGVGRRSGVWRIKRHDDSERRSHSCLLSIFFRGLLPPCLPTLVPTPLHGLQLTRVSLCTKSLLPGLATTTRSGIYWQFYRLHSGVGRFEVLSLMAPAVFIAVA